VAAETFGWSQLRDEQLQAMEQVMPGHDVLAALPTGSGKSAWGHGFRPDYRTSWVEKKSQKVKDIKKMYIKIKRSLAGHFGLLGSYR